MHTEKKKFFLLTNVAYREKIFFLLTNVAYREKIIVPSIHRCSVLGNKFSLFLAL